MPSSSASGASMSDAENPLFASGELFLVASLFGLPVGKPGIAFQWLMEADLYPTDKLLQIGWLNRVVKKEEWGDRKEILKQYTSRSYRQMVLLKRQYSSNLSVAELSGEMEEEVKNSADLWESPEHKEIVANFLAGR